MRRVLRHGGTCPAIALVVACLLSPEGAHALEAEVPIVFASRDLNGVPDPDARVSAIELATSGRLLLREVDGSIHVLVDANQPEADPATPIDVMQPAVSYSGDTIVFAGYSPVEMAWRIYEIEADGGNLRQITQSDRELDLEAYGEAGALFEDYDDVDPHYLPDGRIVFVSTRFPGVAPDSRGLATNLYIVNSDGTDVHRITSERFGGDTPTVDPFTGRIVYSRWWRTGQTDIDFAAGQVEEPEPVPPGSPGYGGGGGVRPGTPSSVTPALTGVAAEEFPGVNSWFLAEMDPDGANLAMLSGFRLDREETQAYRPAFLPDGNIIGLFLPETPFVGANQRNGLRVFRPGAHLSTHVSGPQTFGASGSAPLYVSAEPLTNDTLVVSIATDVRRPDYDLFLQRGEEFEQLFVEAGTDEVDAVPLVARETPPIIEDEAPRLSDQGAQSADEAYEQGGRFTFLVENIFFNAPVDVGVANAPPVGRNLAIEFYMNPQRSSPSIADAPILLHRVEIPPSGRVEVELPAGVPLFEVLRLPNGEIARGRDGQIFHVGGMNFGVAGEQGRCVGCHAGHSMLDVPEDPSWTNIAPGADISASSTLTQINREILPSADALVDRVVADPESVWVARQSSATVELRWGSSVQARELVVYAPAHADDAGNQQRIRAFHFSTFLNGETQQTGTVRQEIGSSGTTAVLDESLPFDSLVVAISRADVEGAFRGSVTPALAEITVDGRAVGTPRGVFLRGDADCSGDLNLSDPIRSLDTLFLGGESFCCDSATDSNADGVINLTDAVYSLRFLFMGGPAPSAPFPACGSGVSDELSCRQEVCPVPGAEGDADRDADGRLPIDGRQ